MARITKSNARTAPRSTVTRASAGAQVASGPPLAAAATPASTLGFNADVSILRGNVSSHVGSLKAPSHIGIVALRPLMCTLPSMGSSATKLADGRRTPVALVYVEEAVTGATRAGVGVQLLDGSRVVDRTYTDSSGLAILRWHADPQADPAIPATTLPSSSAAIRVLNAKGMKTVDGLDPSAGIPVAWAQTTGAPPQLKEQLTELTITLPTIPDPVHILPDPLAVTPAGKVLPPGPRLEEQLNRLPLQFTPELCRRLGDLRSSIPDAIFQRGSGDDFRTHRTPLVKRFSLPRIMFSDALIEGAAAGARFNPASLFGAQTTRTPLGDTCGVKRYLVRMRQEWIFLGYTLGEVTSIQALDPGEVLDETSSNVSHLINDVSGLTQDVLSRATSRLQDIVTQDTSLHSLVDTMTTLHTEVQTSGLFGGLKAILVGGSLGGASMTSDIRVNTGVDTSLFASHLLNTAAENANHLVQTASSQVNDQLRTLKSVLGKVSPLLSRVTNLLHWTLYENYAVLTEVEDVTAIQPVSIFQDAPKTLFSAFTPVFSAADIVDLRPFFQPRLMNNALTAHFDVIAQMLDSELQGGTPTNVVDLEFGYHVTWGKAAVHIYLAGAETTVILGGDATKARARLVLPYALRPTELSTRMTMTVTLLPPDDLGPLTTAAAQQAGSKSIFFDAHAVQKAMSSLVTCTVSSLTVWAGPATRSTPSWTPNQAGVAPFGGPGVIGGALGGIVGGALGAIVGGNLGGGGALLSGLSGIGTSTSIDLDLAFHPTTPNYPANPLFRHINGNSTYYLGLLLEAARVVPSLRFDSHHLRQMVDPASGLWDLPIAGVEGDRLVVMMNPDPNDPEAKQLLADAGSATIVQIAAPGSYGEALEGLLSLTDAAGKLHPKLLPPLPAAVPTIAVVNEALGALADLTGTAQPHAVTTPPVTPAPV